MKHVLVVGGAGYIGGATVDCLMDRGFDVRVYDSLLYEDQFRKPVGFVYGDVRDGDRLKPQLEWADAVVWLAAIVGDGACALHPDVTMSINNEAVRWLARNFDGRIVFTSTCSVYGVQHQAIDEEATPAPLSLYAASKLQAEGHLKDKNSLIFRLGTLYGLGDIFSRLRLDLVVNALTVMAHNQKAITVFGGDQYRPVLHVADVARAIADNLTDETTGIFNIHSENVRILDLAERIASCFEDVRIERTEMEFADERNYRVSSDRAHRYLRFDPQRRVEDGVEQLKRLLAENRIKDLENPRYVNQGFLAKIGGIPTATVTEERK